MRVGFNNTAVAISGQLSTRKGEKKNIQAAWRVYDRTNYAFC